MKNVFISQPMKDKTDKEITEERIKAVREAEFLLNDTVNVVNLFTPNSQDAKKRHPLSLMGDGLKLMSKADAVYFASGWTLARGCVVEEICARLYGIPVLYCGDEDVAPDNNLYSEVKCLINLTQSTEE